MLDLSSKSFGLWAGLGTAAFVGYCIYFDSKRRSHPDFKRKLREKRKAAVKGQSKSSGPQLPDFSDQEAVQRFFLQEVQMGEELLATGDIQNGEGQNMRYEILNKMTCLTSSCRSRASLSGRGCVRPTPLPSLSSPADSPPSDLPAPASELGRIITLVRSITLTQPCSFAGCRPTEGQSAR